MAVPVRQSEGTAAAPPMYRDINASRHLEPAITTSLRLSLRIILHGETEQ